MSEHECNSDLHEQKLLSDIQQYGWHIIAIPQDEEGPAFAYTVGLYGSFKHPELIILGLKSETNIQILKNLGSEIKAGKVFDDSREYDEVLTNYPVSFRKVLEKYYREFFGYAVWYYKGTEFPVLQCVWPDKNNRYPWDADFNRALYLEEPLLDRKQEWPFREPKNLAVFTTRYVLEDRLPILLVTHDEDGSWQFLCGTTDASADAKLVCLFDIHQLDPSASSLAYLPEGWQATRQTASDPWTRKKSD
jgi:hypothetical protein